MIDLLHLIVWPLPVLCCGNVLKSVFDPIGVFSSPGDPGGAARGQAKKQKQALTEGQQAIDAAFAGYTPEFYRQRALEYEKAALPGLSDQYNQSRNAIQFGLANRGLQRSGASMSMGDALAKQLATAKQGIVDTGQAQAQALQQQVEQYRSQLYGQLGQAVSPTSNALGFLGAASQFQVPSALTPMVSSMGNFAQQYLMANLAQQNPNVTQFSGGTGGYTKPSTPSTGKYESVYDVNP